MAEKSNNKKRQKILLGALGVVVIIALVVLFVDFGGSVSESEQTATTTRAIIPEINFSLLDSETFRQFDVWSSIPVTVGETGKENPFGQ